jgi:TolB protein
MNIALALGLALALLQQASSDVIKPAAKNGWPAVSPDGARIAFLSDRTGAPGIFVISATGENEVQVTHWQTEVSSPSWSRDGAQICFAAFDGKSTTRIYSINPDGTNQRQIGQVPGQGADISPDGKQAVYNTSGSWTSTKLSVSNLDGSGARQITDGSSIAWNRRWSPDGRTIAFSGRDSAGNLQVFLMKADGTELRQLTMASPSEGGAQVPAWSPDGRQIAMQVNKGKNYSEVWITDVSTGSTRKFSHKEHEYLDEWPVWFPDGRRLAFQSNRTGRMQVWTMNADGSDQKQATR